MYSTKGYILYRSVWGFRSPDAVRTAIKVLSTLQNLRESCLLWFFAALLTQEIVVVA